MVFKATSVFYSDGALRWIFSYLMGRSQAVVDDRGGCSNWLATCTGVSQGSVLGRLLSIMLLHFIIVNT